MRFGGALLAGATVDADVVPGLHGTALRSDAASTGGANICVERGVDVWHVYYGMYNAIAIMAFFTLACWWSPYLFTYSQSLVVAGLTISLGFCRQKKDRTPTHSWQGGYRSSV